MSSLPPINAGVQLAPETSWEDLGIRFPAAAGSGDSAPEPSRSASETKSSSSKEKKSTKKKKRKKPKDRSSSKGRSSGSAAPIASGDDAASLRNGAEAQIGERRDPDVTAATMPLVTSSPEARKPSHEQQAPCPISKHDVLDIKHLTETLRDVSSRPASMPPLRELPTEH